MVTLLLHGHGDYASHAAGGDVAVNDGVGWGVEVIVGGSIGASDTTNHPSAPAGRIAKSAVRQQ